MNLCPVDPIPTPTQTPTSNETGATGPIQCGEGTIGEGIETAIGCIPTKDTGEFAVWLASWLTGIAGGIAFILIIIAAFQIITSRGNPDQIKAGQQLLTSAISGLILIIFSFFLLKLIAGDILKIPGLT